MSKLILPRKKQIAVAASLLAAPALILSPQGAKALEKAGFAQPSLQLEKRLPLTWLAKTRGIARRKTEPPFEPTYTGFVSSSANLSQYDWGFISTGIPNLVGLYLVGIAARDATIARVNSVEIRAGSPTTSTRSTFTKIAENDQSFGHLQFWVAANAVADEVGQSLRISASGTLNCVGAYIWNIDGFIGTHGGTATTTTDNGSMSFTVPSGAKTFGIASNNNTSATVTVSGATKVATEATIESSQLRSCAAVGTTSPMAFDWSAATNVRALAISLL